MSRITRAQTGEFVVEAAGAKETYRARRVIVATGVSPYDADIPGIELADKYATVSVDPEDFADQQVLIIGKGNSAMETAHNILETAAVIHTVGPNPLQLAWKTHFVGHVRATSTTTASCGTAGYLRGSFTWLWPDAASALSWTTECATSRVSLSFG